MSLEALRAEATRAEAEASAAEEEARRLERELVALWHQQRRLGDMLETDAEGHRLSFAPLLATLFGTLFALGAVMATYILGLMFLQRETVDSDAGEAVLWWALCLVMSGLLYAVGGRAGAGGSARALLRRLVVVLLALSLNGGIAAMLAGSLT